MSNKKSQSSKTAKKSRKVQGKETAKAPAREMGFYGKYIKRTIDIIVALPLSVLMAPLALVIAIAIKLEDGGPVFFVQKRIGRKKDGKLTTFKIVKFRTMTVSAPHTAPTRKLKDPDQYITKVGKILRRTSLDELPQVFQIISGKMAFIGPRPVLEIEEDLIKEREKYDVHSVRPGLTGWAQINGRDKLKPREKAALDGVYVDKMSFLFDCRCFFGTIGVILTRDGFKEGELEEENSDCGDAEIKVKLDESLDYSEQEQGQTVNVGTES